MSKTENRLLTPEVLATLAPYPLYSQETAKIPYFRALVLFCIGGIRYDICEGSPEGDTFTLYGLVCGMCDGPELGYFNADELAGVSVDCARYGFPGAVYQVDQEKDFNPSRLADIDEEDVKEFCNRFTSL